MPKRDRLPPDKLERECRAAAKRMRAHARAAPTPAERAGYARAAQIYDEVARAKARERR